MYISPKCRVKDIEPELAYIDFKVKQGDYIEAIGIVAKGFITKYKVDATYAYYTVIRTIKKVNEFNEST